MKTMGAPDMLRRILICMVVIGLAFSIATVLTVLAKAEQEDKRTEQLTLATQTPLYAQTDVPRCWERQDAPVPVLWFVRGPDGVILVVHGEIARGC